MAQDHTPADLTDEQRANLTKLAAYLRSLPADYPDFAMDDFTSDGGAFAHMPECGTAACAAGHGIAAGIPAKDQETWWSYSQRAFAPDELGGHCTPWDWCFNGEWYRVDNTAHGAAARIEYMLKHGVPDDGHDQMGRRAPLSYRLDA